MGFFESLIKFVEKKYPSAKTKNSGGAYTNSFLIKEDGLDVVFFHLSDFGTVFYSNDGIREPGHPKKAPIKVGTI